MSRLGAPRSATSTPIFQSFVDYRLGQREKTAWADCQLEMLSFQVSKLAYDVALDIIDDPDGDCLVMLIVRKDLYSQRDAECLVKSYSRLVDAFTAHPSTALDEPEIFDPAEIDRAIGFSRGPSHAMLNISYLAAGKLTMAGYRSFPKTSMARDHNSQD
jgi:hybrid polyketide synthase/nonribosomal peptide synthetase ACE1